MEGGRKGLGERLERCLRGRGILGSRVGGRGLDEGLVGGECMKERKRRRRGRKRSRNKRLRKRGNRDLFRGVEGEGQYG